MNLPSDVITETIATVVGIFVGMLTALATDRRNERRRNQRRAKTILRALSQELNDNYDALQAVKPAYNRTPWGKSFYLSTIAWETALSSGDLSDIIGFELTDAISAQYALLVRIRYHVDLLTRLWFAPAEIPGYQEIRQGFNRTIIETMNQAINHHPEIMRQIKEGLKD